MRTTFLGAGLLALVLAAGCTDTSDLDRRLSALEQDVATGDNPTPVVDIFVARKGEAYNCRTAVVYTVPGIDSPFTVCAPSAAHPCYADAVIGHRLPDECSALPD